MKRNIFLRSLSTLIAGCIFCGMLTGCAGNSDQTASGVAAEGESSTEVSDVGTDVESGWNGDISHIILTYLTMGSEPADLDKVEAAVNEISIPEAGVEIEFKPVGIMDSLTQYTTWIASGERVDLMLLAFQDISTYIYQGMLEPLTDIIPVNAPKLAAKAKELDLYGASIVDGDIYGITTPSNKYGHGGSYLVKKALLDETGLGYKNRDIITLDELGEIFAKIKENHPDIYPCGVVGSQIITPYMFTTEPLGADSNSGVLLGTDSTTVVDLYETEEYYDFLKHMREWYEAGYIVRDAAASDITHLEYFSSGTTAGYFADYEHLMRQEAEDRCGEEVIQLTLTDVYTSAASRTGAYWTVPVTSTDPAGAMRFVDLLGTNADVANLLQWGIEGVHYVFVDEANIPGLITFPEGVDAASSGYYNTLGFWGDKSMVYYRDIDVAPSSFEEQNKKALANPTKGIGFCYDSRDMTNQIIAITSVVQEYRAALETGSADLEPTYKEFINKLKASGIDEVIADKQAQFDAWLAQQ